MTEQEWLTATDPTPLINYWVQSPVDIPHRKLRLFACACVRELWGRLIDARSRTSVEVAEQFSDGIATDGQRLRAYEAAHKAAGEAGAWSVGTPMPAKGAAALAAMYASAGPPAAAYLHAQRAAEEAVKAHWMAKQADILRDVAPNLFRPVVFNPACLTPTVTSLAQATYEERSLPSGELDAVRLCVLADALEEAGCTDAAILTHLRSPGPHVRGCWVVDLLLGKA